MVVGYTLEIKGLCYTLEIEIEGLMLVFAKGRRREGVTLGRGRSSASAKVEEEEQMSASIPVM